MTINSIRLKIASTSILFFLAGCISTAGVSNLELSDDTADANLPRSVNEQSADLLSAFFGLDNKLPRRANIICRSGAGKDGMPVIFSTEIDPATMNAGDFEITKQSGEKGSMHCVSLLPATDAGELRTVLLIGEFGDALSDPPARVDVIGHLHSIDGAMDYQGASIEVTPLEPGPSLVMAEIVTDTVIDLDLGNWRTRGSSCPTEETTQAIRVIWAGGVTLEGGREPGQDERQLYTVSVEADDGRLRTVTPIALADLGDGDNNHLLCLGIDDQPKSVSFPAGVFTDPNNDLNPATSVDITYSPPAPTDR